MRSTSCRRRFLRSIPCRSRISLTVLRAGHDRLRVSRPQHLQQLLRAPAVLLARREDQRLDAAPASGAGSDAAPESRPPDPPRPLLDSG